MSFLESLFTWPNRLEERWIGRNADDYDPTASRTLVLSVVSMVVAIIVGNSYRESHGPDSGYNALMWIVYGCIDTAVLFLEAVLAKETWRVTGRGAKWFFCHFLFAFLGGAIIVMAGLFAVVGYGMFKMIQLFCSAGATGSLDGSSPQRGQSVSGIGSSDADSVLDSQPAGGSGNSIEMSNWDDDMTVRTSLGPDRHLTKTETSIYGDIYTDNNTGKQVRVTETDAFGHPTKTEDVWP